MMVFMMRTSSRIDWGLGFGHRARGKALGDPGPAGRRRVTLEKNSPPSVEDLLLLRYFAHTSFAESVLHKVRAC